MHILCFLFERLHVTINSIRCNWTTTFKHINLLSMTLVSSDDCISLCVCYFSVDWIGLSSVLRPRQHSIGYMGDGFYRSDDPTNSVRALKEVVSHPDRPQSNQAHLTVLQ